MAETTEIGWTDSTANFWWGCTKVGGSRACDNCYAETWANRMGFKIWGDDAPRRYINGIWNDIVRWNAAAEKANTRRRVFCMSMGDWAEGRPEQRPHLERLWKLIPQCPAIDFQMLTKRPQLIRSLIPKAWLDNPQSNVWMGVTADTQKWLDIRWKFLREVPAVVHWFSMEPIFESMTLPVDFLARGKRAWCITGGESGAKAQPTSPDIFRTIRDQCVAAGVPHFFKQWGEWAPTNATDLGKTQWMEFVNDNHGLVTTQVMQRIGKKATSLSCSKATILTA
jgi:protein gp37